MNKRILIVFITLLLLTFGFSNQVFAQSTFDRDGDGIPNTNDNCPDEAGPRTNGGCPLPDNTLPDDIPPDSDGDGTADPLDRCPDVAGDGANSGCPAGTDPNAQPDSNPAQPQAQLLVAPEADNCIVSPSGTFGVNMRDTAHPDGSIVHVLQVNEWAELLIVAYQGKAPVFAEHEPAAMEMPFGLQAPFVDPDPDPDPTPEPIDDIVAENPPLWLLIRTEDGFLGWVLESLMRYAGNCTGFDLPDDDPEVLEMFFVPADGNSVGFPDGNPFIIFPIIPDPDPTFDFEIMVPDDGDDDTLDLAAECVWVELSNGASILECLDGTTPSFIYCLIEAGNEAGIFHEVCYQIEIPDGCTMTSSEAGVWHLECEEGGEVDITPLGEDLPILSVDDTDDGILIALLLPAVQAAREAAGR